MRKGLGLGPMLIGGRRRRRWKTRVQKGWEDGAVVHKRLFGMREMLDMVGCQARYLFTEHI